MTIAGRQRGWLHPDFHSRFRHELHRLALRHAIAVPVYCLMPDHMHVLSVGLNHTADQRLWIRAGRREINQLLPPCRLQKQAHDHVLRPDEQGRDAFATLVHYILNNPVRAALVATANDWPYSGCILPAGPELNVHDEIFMDAWWAYWNTSAVQATLSLRSKAAT